MSVLRAVGRTVNTLALFTVAVVVGTACYIGYSAQYKVQRWNRWVIDGLHRGSR